MCFQSAKNEAGLDHYQVPHYQGWYRRCQNSCGVVDLGVCPRRSCPPTPVFVVVVDLWAAGVHLDAGAVRLGSVIHWRVDVVRIVMVARSWSISRARRSRVIAWWVRWVAVAVSVSVVRVRASRGVLGVPV